MQLCAILVVVLACAAPSFSKISIGGSLVDWIKKFLTGNQDGITKKIQDVTISGESGREKLTPEWIKGDCKPVSDALKGKYDPAPLKGKWYGVLQSNDIYKQGAFELLKPNRFCISYDITPTATGLKVVETSFSDVNGKEGKQEGLATLTKTNEGTATFKMEGSQTGFNFAQLTAAKGDDYAVFYYTRQNTNGTCSMKMAALSRTPKITVSNLLAFHDIVLLKNLGTLNLHPRLFHIDQTTCPAL